MGAHFRHDALIHLDKRRKEAWFLERVRESLTEQVGGDPTFSQQLLIQRASILMLRLSMIDQKIIDDDPFTTADNNYTIAWTNALRRILVGPRHQGQAQAQRQRRPPEYRYARDRSCRPSRRLTST
jgi:hypothetical protein